MYYTWRACERASDIRRDIEFVCIDVTGPQRARARARWFHFRVDGHRRHVFRKFTRREYVYRRAVSSPAFVPATTVVRKEDTLVSRTLVRLTKF